MGWKVTKILCEPYINSDNGYWQIKVSLSGYGIKNDESLIACELYSDIKEIKVGSSL